MNDEHVRFRTLDGAFYVYELRGVLYLSFVQSSEIHNAGIFPAGKSEHWQRILEDMAGQPLEMTWLDGAPVAKELPVPLEGEKAPDAESDETWYDYLDKKFAHMDMNNPEDIAREIWNLHLEQSNNVELKWLFEEMRGAYARGHRARGV